MIAAMKSAKAVGQFAASLIEWVTECVTFFS